MLEATCLDPVDTRTLSYYEQTTPCLIAMNARIFDAVSSVLQSNTTMQLFDGTSEAELIQTVRTLRQRNTGNAAFSNQWV